MDTEAETVQIRSDDVQTSGRLSEEPRIPSDSEDTEHSAAVREEDSQNPSSQCAGESVDQPILVEDNGASTEKENKGLPLARVRAMINADNDVGNVSKASVILIAKATELFIAQLASDAARHISSTKRKTIQLHDLASVVGMCDEYAFLDGIDLGQSNSAAKKSSNTVTPVEDSNPLDEVIEHD